MHSLSKFIHVKSSLVKYVHRTLKQTDIDPLKVRQLEGQLVGYSSFIYVLHMSIVINRYQKNFLVAGSGTLA